MRDTLILSIQISPFFNLVYSCQAFHENGFARSRRTQDDKIFFVLNGKIQVLEGKFSDLDGKIFDFNHMPYLLPVIMRINSKAASEITTSINIKATACPILAEDKLRKIEIGKVSVLMAVAPASVTVAPNSPTALAQVRMPAAIKPSLARGRITLKKASGLLHPSVRADLFITHIDAVKSRFQQADSQGTDNSKLGQHNPGNGKNKAQHDYY